MSSIQGKSYNKNLSKTIVFDGGNAFQNLPRQPLSVEKIKELEGTLGKAILERLQKELNIENLAKDK